MWCLCSSAGPSSLDTSVQCVQLCRAGPCVDHQWAGLVLGALCTVPLSCSIPHTPPYIYKHPLIYLKTSTHNNQLDELHWLDKSTIQIDTHTHIMYVCISCFRQTLLPHIYAFLRQYLFEKNSTFTLVYKLLKTY